MLKSKVQKQLVKLSEHVEFCSLKFYTTESRLLDKDNNHVMSFYNEKQFMDWSNEFIRLKEAMKKHLSVDYYEDSVNQRIIEAC